MKKGFLARLCFDELNSIWEIDIISKGFVETKEVGGTLFCYLGLRPKGHVEFIDSFSDNKQLDDDLSCDFEGSILVYSYSSRSCSVFSSGYGLIPVYYVKLGTDYYITDNLNSLFEWCDELDHESLLISTVLNFPLGNRSFLKNVKRIGENETLVFGNGSICPQIKTHRQSTELDENEYISAKDIYDVFRSCLSDILPYDTNIAAALTGGFDSRAALAALLELGYSPSTYTFGVSDSLDMTVADEISHALNIVHTRFEINEAYYKGKFLELLRSGILNGNGLFNFARTHYILAFSGLKEKGVESVITGNGGSELFRKVKNSGIHLPSLLFLLVHGKGLEEAISEELRKNRVWKLISEDEDDVSETIYKASKEIVDHIEIGSYSSLFNFIVKETFPNWYGVEMYLAKQIGIWNYSPYLNMKLKSAVLKSEYSLVKRKLDDDGFRSRTKGQSIYARFIKYSENEELYRAMSSKGYSPRDLIELYRIPKLIQGKVRQRQWASRDEFGSKRNREWFYELFREEAGSLTEFNISRIYQFANGDINEFEKRRVDSLTSTLYWKVLNLKTK